MRSTKVWKTQHEYAFRSLNEHLELYDDWIWPNRYCDFKDLEVLDAGSGPGIQARLFAKYANSVTAIDLEALEVTKNNVKDLKNVICINADIRVMSLDKQFDVVNCVGTIHHTDDPTETFRNLFSHLKPGGRMIIWAYSKEGNFIMEKIIEPFRKHILKNASSSTLKLLSYILTSLMWMLGKTVYKVNLTFLPYKEYMNNFARLSFQRNLMNVYDKLNAPQQYFIENSTIKAWFNDSDFKDVHVSPYIGVSWRATGIKR